MAVPRDNMFGLFAGAPGVGGRQERRRQFALGPSQIANLPGNFPMPRTCSPRAPRPRREAKKRERATPTRARFGARRRSGSKHRESPERPLAGLPRVFSLPEAPKLVILTPPSLGVPSSRNTRRPAGRGSPGRGVRRAANRRPERRARNRRDKRAAPGGSAAAAAAHGRDGRARERAAETEKPAGAGAGGAGARRASRRRSIRG